MFLVLSVAVVALLLDKAADRENEIARANSVHLARTAVAGLHTKLSTLDKDYAFWTATVKFAQDPTDMGWAESNIGTYLQDTFGITGSYVVDAAEATIYHSSREKGAARPPDAVTFLGPQSAVLFAKARATNMNDPNPFLTHAMWGGTVFVVSATAITPDVPAPRSTVRYRRPILLLYQAITPETVAELGAQYLLRELRVAGAAGRSTGA